MPATLYAGIAFLRGAAAPQHRFGVAVWKLSTLENEIASGCESLAFILLARRPERPAAVKLYLSGIGSLHEEKQLNDRCRSISEDEALALTGGYTQGNLPDDFREAFAELAAHMHNEIIRDPMLDWHKQ